MTGGTFTITNGGVFGSMLSTPIINPPQSAILGMHNIIERPIAVSGGGNSSMMYVALSYDHRIIDGKESVGFLVAIKEALENNCIGYDLRKHLNYNLRLNKISERNLSNRRLFFFNFSFYKVGCQMSFK
jgi:hypothetical protein